MKKKRQGLRKMQISAIKCGKFGQKCGIYNTSVQKLGNTNTLFLDTLPLN